METKIGTFKKGIQIVLVVLLLTSCNPLSQGESIKSKTSKNIVTVSKSEKSEPDKRKLLVFKSSISDLRKELEAIKVETEDTADVSKVIVSYEELDNPETFLSDGDRAVFESLRALGKIEAQENSPKVGALQQTLADTNFFELEPEDQPIYGERTNKSLITYLVEIENKVDNLEAVTRATANSNSAEPPSPAISQTSSDPVQKDRKMPFEIIPLLLGLILFGSLSSLAFWIWRLSRRIDKLHNIQNELEQKISGLDEEKGQLHSEIQDTRQSLEGQLHREIQNTYQSLERIKSQESSLQNELNMLKTKLEDRETTLYNSIQGFKQDSIINNQASKSQQTSDRDQSVSNSEFKTHPDPAFREQPASSSNATTACRQLVQQYNQSPSSLASYAVGVSQTEKSLKLNLQDSTQTSVVLARDNSPNYWILIDNSDDYWLFPKEDWNPSIGTLESFVKLFKFTGKPSQNYRIIMPASVVTTNQGDWALKDVGEIEFN